MTIREDCDVSNGKRTRGGNNSGGGGGNQQRRRRSGGGGRGQQSAPRGPAMTALGESTYEAVFDHGNDGYGVWFDGVVRDDPMYKQFWKGTGTRPMYVQILEDRIVLTKELDRDLPPLPSEAPADQAESLDDTDVDAAIEEAVAEAVAAAESGGDDSVVYSPEDAARLFAGAADDAAADPEVDESADADPAADEAPKPKRRATARKRTVKAKDADAAAADD